MPATLLCEERQDCFRAVKLSAVRKWDVLTHSQVFCVKESLFLVGLCRWNVALKNSKQCSFSFTLSRGTGLSPGPWPAIQECDLLATVGVEGRMPAVGIGRGGQLWGWPAVEMAGGGGGQVVGMGGGGWPGSGDRGKMAVSRDLDSSRGSCPLQPLLVTVRKCRHQIA